MTKITNPNVVSLETRYATSHVGGAYDAKQAGTSTEFSPQAQRYNNTGQFVVKQPHGVSNFKGANSSNYKEISALAQKLDTTKYSG
jgi:hypothetical protein